MLKCFENIMETLKSNGYEMIQYIPTRQSIAIGQELRVFNSFFYQIYPCLFNSSCFYFLYHRIFRTTDSFVYKLYEIFFLNYKTDKAFLLSLFNQSDINSFIMHSIVKEEDDKYEFNYRFIPYEEWLLIGKADPEGKEYVHIGYDSVTFVEALRQRMSKNKSKAALEIGCGAGLISMELSRYAEHVDAVDINPYAVEVMGINAHLNSVSNINVIQSNIYENIKKKYDLIVSDPPFEIMPDEKKEVLHRFGGNFGKEVAMKILNGLDEFLEEDGEAIVFTNSYIRNYSKDTLREELYESFKNKRFEVTLYILSYQINQEFYEEYFKNKITYSISYIIHIKRATKFEMTVIPLPLVRRLKEILRVLFLYCIIYIKIMRKYLSGEKRGS